MLFKALNHPNLTVIVEPKPLPTTFDTPWEPEVIATILNTYRAMPAYNKIPKDYTGRKKCQALQGKWFFEGLRKGELDKVRPGICREHALVHLHFIQSSMDIEHRYESEAVAYLISLWFEI